MATTSNVRSPSQQQVPVPVITNPLARSNPQLPPEIVESAGVTSPVPEIPENTYSQQSASYDIPEEDNTQFFEGDPGRGVNQGPQVYQDVKQSGFWQGGVGKFGKEIMPDELMARIRDDQEAEMKRAGIFTLGWRDDKEIKSAHPYMGPDHVGTVRRASQHIADALGKTTITEASERGVRIDSAFNKIKDTFNLSPAQTANVATVATALVMPIISGATQRSGSSKEQIDAMDMFNSMLEGDFSVTSPEQIDGGIELKLAQRMWGSAINKLASRANNAMDSHGRPIDPSTVQRGSLKADETGAAAVNALAASGYLNIQKNDKGVESVVISPIYGHELYMATKDLASEFSEAMLGRATSAPVTDIGKSRTAARNIVGSKPSPDQADLVEVERILGSTPMMVSAKRSWLAAAMFKLGMDYHSGMGINTTKHAMISMPVSPEPDDDAAVKAHNKVLRTKASIVSKLLKGFGGFISRSIPMFAEHWSDPTVRRMYNKTNDLNPQRHIMTRAVISSNEVPRQWRSNIHNTGVSKDVAYKWWEDVGSYMRSPRDDYSFKSATMDELNFLFTVAHALDLGHFHDKSRETASYLPQDLIRLLTPDRMKMFSDFGYKLKQVIPQSNAQIGRDLIQPDNIELTPQQKVVIEELVARAGKKEWGFYAQACMDLDDYLASKENGTPFVPKLLTAIDLNSAGRSFLAMDIGNVNVLEHVGVHWDWAYNQDYQNTLPNGSPRNFFIDLALTRGVRQAFNDSDPEARQFWEATIRDAVRVHGKDFVDDFGKKVLMTTDYGKAYNYHQEEAKELLESYPDFSRKVMHYYNHDVKAGINAINDIFKGTLFAAGDLWQQDTPKTVVKLLAMYDRTPTPKGIFDEEMFIGGFIEKNMGTNLKIDGIDRSESIELTKRVYSALARAKYKGGKDLNGNPLEAPGEGTAAINQMGPILGQYRESALIALTLLYINKGKPAKDILFTQPVFDNLILAPSSMSQFYYVANNIIAPQVMAWDIQTDIKDNFLKQMKEGSTEVDKAGTVDIGVNGKYYGTLVTLDREWKYLDPADMNKGQTELYKFLSNPASGYVPPEEGVNRGSIIISAAQHRAMVAAIYKYKMTKYVDGKARNALDLWVTEGLIKKKRAMAKALDLAKRGHLSFMT